MFRYAISLFLNISFLAIGVYPQTKPLTDKEEVIRVDTQLVDVPLSVTSSDGRPVGDLKSSNFIIYEDGKLQKIESFSTAAAPFEVALVLDTSGSARSDLQLIKKAAQDFVASLKPGDRVAVSAFDTEIIDGRTTAFSSVLSPLSQDRPGLMAAIGQVRTSFGTPYYDSLLQVADIVFRDPPKAQVRGRRAIVALTDGVDSTSRAGFEEVRERLQKLGIVCFFVEVDTRDFFESGLLGDCRGSTQFSVAQIRKYYRSIGARLGTEKATTFCQLGDFERLAISKRLYELAESEMSELARNSGGRVFPVADLNEARRAFQSVADAIGTQFTIGYYPTNEKRDGSYRKIKVETRGLAAGTQIRAREGYTAPTN